MESTGVYWKPLFYFLIGHGFDVYLVNAQHVRNVTGRKTDQSDAEWLQQLHTCGLLKSSYLPDNEQETLRAMVRHRKTLTQESSSFVLRMETAIIEAIVAGERKAENFLPFIDGRIKADHQKIVQ